MDMFIGHRDKTGFPMHYDAIVPDLYIRTHALHKTIIADSIGWHRVYS